jgi:hypothetical protein
MKINVSLVICNILLWGIYQPLFAQYTIATLDSNNFILGEGVVLSKTSFRGLSVVNDKTIWVSGSRGTIAMSNDSGKTFHFSQLTNYAKSDFRDVEAFDANNAIIMSSGTPALILKTTDGGRNWKEVFRKDDSSYFLDAMDFWDSKKGIIVGDPIHGHFVLLQTNDGGDTWQEIDSTRTPNAIDGEAIFAASGTSLRCWGKNSFGFVTGGAVSRFIVSSKKLKHIQYIKLKMMQGENSRGTFSFAKSKQLWLFAGGDYVNDTQITDANFYYCHDWKQNEHCSILGIENLNGYKSCIEVINDEKNVMGSPFIIATGTSGTQIGKRVCSYVDTHFSYTNFTSQFHVVRKAKHGKSVYLAGPKGKIGKLIY